LYRDGLRRLEQKGSRGLSSREQEKQRQKLLEEYEIQRDQCTFRPQLDWRCTLRSPPQNPSINQAEAELKRLRLLKQKLQTSPPLKEVMGGKQQCKPTPSPLQTSPYYPSQEKRNDGGSKKSSPTHDTTPVQQNTIEKKQTETTPEQKEIEIYNHYSSDNVLSSPIVRAATNATKQKRDTLNDGMLVNDTLEEQGDYDDDDEEDDYDTTLDVNRTLLLEEEITDMVVVMKENQVDGKTDMVVGKEENQVVLRENENLHSEVEERRLTPLNDSTIATIELDDEEEVETSIFIETVMAKQPDSQSAALIDSNQEDYALKHYQSPLMKKDKAYRPPSPVSTPMPNASSYSTNNEDDNNNNALVFVMEENQMTAMNDSTIPTVESEDEGGEKEVNKELFAENDHVDVDSTLFDSTPSNNQGNDATSPLREKETHDAQPSSSLPVTTPCNKLLDNTKYEKRQPSPLTVPLPPSPVSKKIPNNENITISCATTVSDEDNLSPPPLPTSSEKNSNNATHEINIIEDDNDVLEEDDASPPNEYNVPTEKECETEQHNLEELFEEEETMLQNIIGEKEAMELHMQELLDDVINTPNDKVEEDANGNIHHDESVDDDDPLSSYRETSQSMKSTNLEIQQLKMERDDIVAKATELEMALAEATNVINEQYQVEEEEEEEYVLEEEKEKDYDEESELDEYEYEKSLEELSSELLLADLQSTKLQVATLMAEKENLEYLLQQNCGGGNDSHIVHDENDLLPLEQCDEPTLEEDTENEHDEEGGDEEEIISLEKSSEIDLEANTENSTKTDDPRETNVVSLNLPEVGAIPSRSPSVSPSVERKRKRRNVCALQPKRWRSILRVSEDENSPVLIEEKVKTRKQFGKNMPDIDEMCFVHAVSTVPHEYQSDNASYFVRRPRHCVVDDGSNVDITDDDNDNIGGNGSASSFEEQYGKKSQNVYSYSFNVTNPESVEVIVRIEADLSILVLHGKSSVRHWIPQDDGIIENIDGVGVHEGENGLQQQQSPGRQRRRQSGWGVVHYVDGINETLGSKSYTDDKGNECEYCLDTIVEEALATREMYCMSILSAAAVLQDVSIRESTRQAAAAAIVANSSSDRKSESPAPSSLVRNECTQNLNQLIPEKKSSNELSRAESKKTASPSTPEKAAIQSEVSFTDTRAKEEVDSGALDIISIFLTFMASTLLGIFWRVCVRLPLRVASFTFLLSVVGVSMSVLYAYLVRDGVYAVMNTGIKAGYNQAGIY